MSSLQQHILNHGIIFGDRVEDARYGFFLDLRQALQTSGYLKQAGRMMWDKIRNYQPEVLIGTGLGAINVLNAVQIAAEEDQQIVNTLIVREKKKNRNRKRLVEGPRPRPFARSIYIDDAFNTGNTYRKCLQTLDQEGIKLDIMACCVLFDFWNPYGSRRLEATGMPFFSLFTRHDFGITRIDPKNRSVEKQILWRNLADNQWPYYYKSPPTIKDNLLIYANDRHEVFCHEVLSGNLQWYFKGQFPSQPKGISATPVIDNERVLISSYDGFIYALDLYNGRELAKVRLDRFLHSTPLVKDNEIYIGTEGGLDKKRGDIVCLDSSTLSTKWRFPTRDVVPCSPYKVNDQVICGSNDGYLYSLTNGRLNWSVYLGVVKGRPASIDRVIIVCTEDGDLYGLSLEGKFLWHRTCGTKTLHQFLPTHPSGLVYVVNQDHYCIAYDQLGNQRWARKLRAPAYYNISLLDDELCIVTENGYTVILDAMTGQKIQQSWLPLRARSPAAFTRNVIAVNTLDKGLIVYERSI